MSKFQTGFFMYWAETTEILGRDETFQTGTAHFLHEYCKGLQGLILTQIPIFRDFL